jgi:hypothetical protein
MEDFTGQVRINAALCFQFHAVMGVQSGLPTLDVEGVKTQKEKNRRYRE